MLSAAGWTATHIQQATGATYLDPAGGSKLGVGVTDCWENPNSAASDAIFFLTHYSILT